MGGNMSDIGGGTIESRSAELENRLSRRPKPGERAYEPRGSWLRLLAFMIDLIIYFVVAGTVVFSIGLSMGIAPLEIATSPRISGGSVLAVYVAAWFVYFAGLEAIFGRTVGKMALGLRVIGADLRKCRWGEAFIRNTTKLFARFRSSASSLPQP